MGVSPSSLLVSVLVVGIVLAAAATPLTSTSVGAVRLGLAVLIGVVVVVALLLLVRPLAALLVPISPVPAPGVTGPGVSLVPIFVVVCSSQGDY